MFPMSSISATYDGRINVLLSSYIPRHMIRFSQIYRKLNISHFSYNTWSSYTIICTQGRSFEDGNIREPLPSMELGHAF